MISCTEKNPSVGVCSTRCEWENLYGRSLGSPIKPHKSVNIGYVHLLHLCRPHKDDTYSLWVWQSVAGVSSSTPPARLCPKLGAFLVVGLSVVHAGREYTNMLDWRQVRGSGRPIEMIHIVLLQELLYYPRPMRSCVVILQHDYIYRKKK